ncbi:MAG: YckD family protein [Anaerolineales bacterium]|nr:YckD family protein [Anaerolineales bacterium]
MVKNLLFIVLGAVIAVVILGVAGISSAQTQTPPSDVAPYNRPFGGMGRWNKSGQFGFMHEYFIAAIAPKLGMSAEALQAELAAGKTLWEVAELNGIALTQFQTLMLEAKKEALSKMVADGVITQAQADWMLSHMNWMFQKRHGFGGVMGPCHGGSWGRPWWHLAPTPTPGSGS